MKVVSLSLLEQITTRRGCRLGYSGGMRSGMLLDLSIPKISSDLDSRAGAESSHHETGSFRSFMPLEWLLPTASSRVPDLKPRYCLSNISWILHFGTHRGGFGCTVVIAPS